MLNAQGIGACMYLTAIEQMLNLFIATGHINYAKNSIGFICN